MARMIGTGVALVISALGLPLTFAASAGGANETDPPQGEGPLHLETSPAWTLQGHGALSVATAGDVNGDGFSDVILGNPNYSNGETSEGTALVYLGSATGLSTIPSWQVESNQAFAQLGFSVASAGDVNGDGFHDVIVGARHYHNGQVDEGKVFLYLGSPGTGLLPGMDCGVESGRRQLRLLRGERRRCEW